MTFFDQMNEIYDCKIQNMYLYNFEKSHGNILWKNYSFLK